MKDNFACISYYYMNTNETHPSKGYVTYDPYDIYELKWEYLSTMKLNLNFFFLFPPFNEKEFLTQNKVKRQRGPPKLSKLPQEVRRLWLSYSTSHRVSQSIAVQTSR
jgi:hypothetical protein